MRPRPLLSLPLVALACVSAPEPDPHASSASPVVAAAASFPTDPLVCERPDFSPVPPLHYTTYQWPSGCSMYHQAQGIGLRDAWALTHGRALLGFADAGIAYERGGALTIHPDLAPNFREHLSVAWGPTLRGVWSDGSPWGHGMHVMGIAAAAADNGVGGAGVCPGCATVLVSHTMNRPECYILDRSYPRTASGFAACNLDDLVAAGAVAVNMSFGIVDTDGVLSRAITRATERGVVVVAAVGNSAVAEDAVSTIDFPASHPDVIAVAGTDHQQRRWRDPRYPRESASNHGPGVTLAAPAHAILSATYPGANYADTTQPPCDDASHGERADGYGLCSGTSMATPFVTGAVGMLRSVNPLLSNDDTRDALRATATAPDAPALELGAGILHVGRAVQRALPTSAGRLLGNRLTPLFTLYSERAQDALATTSPQSAMAALCETTGRRRFSGSDPHLRTDPSPYGMSADPVVTGYRFPESECTRAVLPRAAVYVLTTETSPMPGAAVVPLYRYSFVGEYGGNPDDRDTAYLTDPSERAGVESVGYRLDGVEGWIFASPQPGTVRLLRRYHPGRDDVAVFADTQLARYAAEGYTELWGPTDVLGWVYPNTDRDGDGLIDGFEALLGTDPALRDSDGDGRGDGAEVPLAGLPVSDPRVANCAAPLAACGRCVDLASDPSHCGACGNTCAGGATCTAGRCACRRGFSSCDGRCVDTLSDPLHCGGCRRSCDPPNAVGVCARGRCAIQVCLPGHEDADGDVRNGCEREIGVETVPREEPFPVVPIGDLQ